MRKGKYKSISIISASMMLILMAVMPVQAAVLSNGGFESGTASWKFYSSDSAGSYFTTTTTDVAEGKKAALVFLNKRASNMQVYQDSLKVKSSTQYTLTFSAKSSSGHDLGVRLLKHGAPYTNYGLSQTVDLTTEWQTFTIDFTSSGFSGVVNDGRLMFWLVPYGYAGDTYYIDNVKLEKSTPSPPVVVSYTPTGTGVSLSAPIKVTFSKPMNMASVVKAFSIVPSTPGSYSWTDNMLIFTPTSNLAASTVYSVTIGTGAKDLDSHKMAAPHTWSFTTGTAAPPSANIVANPKFDLGVANWRFYTNGAGSFTIDGIGVGYSYNPFAHVKVTGVGSNTQLYQKDLVLKPYTDYRLTFDAYSTAAGHDMAVKLLKHVSPYTNYGLSHTFDLSTSWQTFTVDFTTSGFSSNVNDGRLMFWLAPYASAGDNYFIDNVRLEEI